MEEQFEKENNLLNKIHQEYSEKIRHFEANQKMEETELKVLNQQINLLRKKDFSNKEKMFTLNQLL